MHIRSVAVALTLASVLAVPAAHAAPRDGSLTPSEALAVSVVLSPVLVISGIGASVGASVNASGKASTTLSEALSANTDWTVVGLRDNADVTQIDLQSADGTLRMAIGVPAHETAARGIRLQDHITMKRLGTDSFAAEYQGRALGVLSDPAARLAHSNKRR